MCEQVSEGQNTDARQAGRNFVIWIVSRKARKKSTEGQIWYDMMWRRLLPRCFVMAFCKSRWNHVESRGFCYWIFCFLFSVISDIFSLRIESHLPVHCCFLQVHLGFFSGSCHGIGLGLAEWRSTCHAVAHQNFQSACECVVAVTCAWFWVCNKKLRV